MNFAQQLIIAALVSTALGLAGCSESSDSSGGGTTANDGGSTDNTGSGNDTTGGNSGDTGGDNTTGGDSGSTGGSDTTGGDSGGTGGDDTTGGDSGGTGGDDTTGGDSGSAGGDDTTSGDSGSDNGSGTVDPVACQSTTHLGQAFQTSQGSDSDPVFHSALAADGCLDATSVWSGDSGDVLVLDTGTPQPMQGIYVWPRYNQLNWLEVSTSTDGTNWSTEWQAIPTRPVQGPQYLSFRQPRSLRWVRIKGLKGQLNDWINISEVRWSLTGENVTVPKALRNDANNATFNLSAWSTHPRLGITKDIASFGSGAYNCGFYGQYASYSPTYLWFDLNGLQDTTYRRTDLPGNIVAFSYNWALLDWPSDFTINPDASPFGWRSAAPADGSHNRSERVILDNWNTWSTANILSDRELSTANMCYSSGATSDSWLGHLVGWYEMLAAPDTVQITDFH